MNPFKLFLSLSPAPIFFLLGCFSLFKGHSMCGGFMYEMPLMWFVMCMAHILPWWQYLEQRRYRKITLPVKQQ